MGSEKPKLEQGILHEYYYRVKRTPVPRTVSTCLGHSGLRGYQGQPWYLRDRKPVNSESKQEIWCRV